VTPLQAPLSPEEVLTQIAAALPPACREHVIIIGSLAAGYHFFAGDGQRSIRTKDVDCMFTPHATAVATAQEVTVQLLNAGWTPRMEGKWSDPGDAQTPANQLPLVRLKPPESGQTQDWFVEMLGAPDQHSGDMKTFHRVITDQGHYAICSFNFLGLTEHDAALTPTGLRLATPEMMALANMLHHPTIGPELIAGTTTKRSNKDLGRVLALAWLTAERDKRAGSAELEAWPERMFAALKSRFPDSFRQLAKTAGAGIRELSGSQADMQQALIECNRGLLSSMEVGLDAFAATARRFVQLVVEPLEQSF